MSYCIPVGRLMVDQGQFLMVVEECYFAAQAW